MSELLAFLRQLRWPRPLRIPGARHSLEQGGVHELVERLAEALDGSDPQGLEPDFARRVGTLAWRIESRVSGLPPSDDTEWLVRRLDLLSRALRGQGLEIRDYSGQAYDPNEIWDEVLGSAGPKDAPTIVSMQKPRLLLNGAVIQRGVPVVEDAAETSSHGGTER